MEYDNASIPEKATPDTPEGIQECLKLRSIIHNQLDDWCDILDSHHPSVLAGGVARIIASNCTPKEQSNDDLEGTPFETGLSPKEARRIRQKREQHATIASIAQNDSADTFQPSKDELSDPALDEYFKRIMFFTENTNSPPAATDAVRYLHRIYTTEEYLSEQLKSITYPNEQHYKYVLLLERIFFDLY